MPRAALCPPHILFIHDGHGPLRGAESVACTLLAGLHGKAARYVVLTNHAAFADATRTLQIPTEELPFRTPIVSGSLYRNFRDFFRFAAIAIRTVRHHDIALIHVNNGGSCAWAAAAAIRCRVPLLVHLHSNWSARMQFLLGMHHADRIVGVCRTILRHFEVDPIARHRTRVIYNGVRIPEMPQRNRDQARQVLGVPPESKVVAALGALLRDKRVDVAIEALRRLPEDLREQVTLLVIGDGPERTALEELARDLPVHFTGFRNDVAGLLWNVIDIVVLPSATEAFNLVLLEAAAAGLPRIASNVGGIPESIRDGVDGILVPVGDCAALAQAIADLLRDPALGRRYGEAAQERVRSEFTVDRFLAEFTSLYREMLLHPPPAPVTRLANVLRSVIFQVGSRVSRRVLRDRSHGRDTGGATAAPSNSIP